MKKLLLTLLISISLIGTASALTFSNSNSNSNAATTKEKTQIEWVDGLYAKSITDEFTVLSKDFSKSVESGDPQITPLGWGDFSGDGIPELVYGIQYWDLKKALKLSQYF